MIYPFPSTGNHFGEGRGMHSFIVVSGDCSGFCLYPRQYGIDKGGFADSGMSGKKGNPAFQHSFYFVYSVAVFGGNLEAGVADVGVQVNQGIQVMPFVPVINIRLVEYQFHRNPVSLCGCEKTVDENGGGFGVVDGNHQHALVEIGGKYVGLFGEIGGTADDIVFSLFYFIDESGSFLVEYNLDTVAYGYRIGYCECLLTGNFL